ncbi:hypothetical protein U1Q18_047861 [Sarracenia purpurea var. burkii]
MERSHRRKEDQNPSKNLQQQHNNKKQEPEHERPQTATGTQKKLNNGRNRSVELAKPTQARNRTKSQHIPNRGQPEPKHNNPECNTSSRDEIEPKTKQAPRAGRHKTEEEDCDRDSVKEEDGDEEDRAVVVVEEPSPPATLNNDFFSHIVALI